MMRLSTGVAPVKLAPVGKAPTEAVLMDVILVEGESVEVLSIKRMQRRYLVRALQRNLEWRVLVRRGILDMAA